jgi:hypothetical protein
MDSFSNGFTWKLSYLGTLCSRAKIASLTDSIYPSMGSPHLGKIKADVMKDSIPKYYVY